MTEKLRQVSCLDNLALKCIAMLSMLVDHAGVVLFPDVGWLHCVGRLAFPIFAFLIAEGFTHTRNFRKYFGRMVLFALLSEIPFNLACSGQIRYPGGQNVLWTFCLSLLLLQGIEWIMANYPDWDSAAICAAVVLGVLLGDALRVDYGGRGVAMVLLFWLCRRGQWNHVGMLVGMVVINCLLMGGRQCWAMLSLLPIWLYNGQPGPKNRVIQYTCYAFYPVHMLLLVSLALLTQ